MKKKNTRKLYSLLEAWAAATRDTSHPQPPLYDGPNVAIANFVEHTDHVESGSCFFARVRTGTDGHVYIGEAVKRGASLIALQKNRYWQTLDGLSLDVGAFVAALEYGAETEAAVIGKPNRAYFEVAVKDLGLPSHKVGMVGDDIFTDIKGGQAAGLTTILVKTGKFRAEDLASASVQPDYLLSSIRELPEIL